MHSPRLRLAPPCSVSALSGPPHLSLGSLGVTPRLVCNHASSRVCRESMPSPEMHALDSPNSMSSPSPAVWRSERATVSASPSFPHSMVSSVSTSRRFWSFLSFVRSADSRFWPLVAWEVCSNNVTPNHALQRTATLAFSYRRAALTSTGSVTAYAPAMKPSIRRACASRRRAHTRALGSRSLSLGSLGFRLPVP